MSDAGVNLIIHRGSVINIQDLINVKELTRQWPIRGVVQGAMVLQVSLPEQAGVDTF